MNFFAQAAWFNGQWSHDVRLTLDQNGLWSAIATDQTCPPHVARALMSGRDARKRRGAHLVVRPGPVCTFCALAWGRGNNPHDAGWVGGKKIQ